VLNELKTMGPEFRAAAIDARKGAALHYCGHGGSDGDVNDRRRQQQGAEGGETSSPPVKNEPCLPAAACLASCVGPAGNAEHFIVATQDRALRAALGQTPAGAAIFLTASGAQFEPPTEAQKRASAAMGAADRGALPGERAPMVRGCDGEALEEVARAARRAWAKDTGVAFRRNRAKGPNPLSVKKKKIAKKAEPQQQQQQQKKKKKKKKEKKPEEKKKKEKEVVVAAAAKEETAKTKAPPRARPRRKKREEGEAASAVPVAEN